MQSNMVFPGETVLAPGFAGSRYGKIAKDDGSRASGVTHEKGIRLAAFGDFGFDIGGLP
jgi:hypothetical protein